VPSGILAHTGAETVNGVFRPQSGGRLASGEAHAFPNPFNAAVSLPVPGDSDRVEIFDLLGRRIRLFELGPGTPAVIWTGQDDAGRAVASGVYLFRVSGRGDPRTGRLTLIR
jgi:hypothetical protein